MWRGCRREQAREISAAESKPSFAKMGNDGEPSMGDEGGEDMYCFRCRDKENDIVTGEQRPIPPPCVSLSPPLASPTCPHISLVTYLPTYLLRQLDASPSTADVWAHVDVAWDEFAAKLARTFGRPVSLVYRREGETAERKVQTEEDFEDLCEYLDDTQVKFHAHPAASPNIHRSRSLLPSLPPPRFQTNLYLHLSSLISHHGRNKTVLLNSHGTAHLSGQREAGWHVTPHWPNRRSTRFTPRFGAPPGVHAAPEGPTTVETSTTTMSRPTLPQCMLLPPAPRFRQGAGPAAEV